MPPTRCSSVVSARSRIHGEQCVRFENTGNVCDGSGSRHDEVSEVWRLDLENQAIADAAGI